MKAQARRGAGARPQSCRRRPFGRRRAGGGPYLADGSATSAYVNEFVTSHYGLRLAKAVLRVRPALHRRIVALVNEIAGEE
jgi:hypothetical protein